MRSFFQRRQQQPAQLATAIGYEFFPMLFAAAWCNCPTRSAPLGETRKMLPIRRKRTLTPLWSKYAPVPHECTPLIVRRTTSTLNQEEEAGWRWRDSKQWSTFTLLPNRSNRDETSRCPLRRSILLRRTACISDQVPSFLPIWSLEFWRRDKATIFDD